MAPLLLAIIYLTFISLGLPDALLGTAWPAMHTDLSTPLAAQSIISLTISCCTIISSLLTARLIRSLGTGKLTALSVALTATAILAFGRAETFWQICLISIPYGLGAGAIDASLNNYVALNYSARHMSWLHCCWGIGASVGPIIMGWSLAGQASWRGGYLAVGIIQASIATILLLSLPLWRSASTKQDDHVLPDRDADPEKSERPHGCPAKRGVDCGNADQKEGLSNRELLGLPGATAAILSFGFYCALESSVGLWAASYLVAARDIDAASAASAVGRFFLGITLGRLLSGLIAQSISSSRQIRIGQALITLGLAALITLDGPIAINAAIFLMGFGCAPIYPSIIALTPHRFGERASQGMVGLQMACAYAGSTLIPPVFGIVAGGRGASSIPLMIALLLAMHIIFANRAEREAARGKRRP